MSSAHRELAAGRWQQLSFCEQMANIGSEINRALTWRTKGNEAYSGKALDRAFELLSLTTHALTDPVRYKELTRLREAINDYFFGNNQFASTELLWRKYFDHFAYAARRNA